MLWYKAWQESRIRFLITASAVTGFCVFATLSHRQLGPVGSGSLHDRIHHLIYAGTAKGTFATLSIFLGLGGLVRERAHRTAIFTLALPVSRLQLLATQIGVGLLQLAMVSIIPVRSAAGTFANGKRTLLSCRRASLRCALVRLHVLDLCRGLSSIDNHGEGVHGASCLLHSAQRASANCVLGTTSTVPTESYVDDGCIAWTSLGAVDRPHADRQPCVRACGPEDT